MAIPIPLFPPVTIAALFFSDIETPDDVLGKRAPRSVSARLPHAESACPASRLAGGSFGFLVVSRSFHPNSLMPCGSKLRSGFPRNADPNEAFEMFLFLSLPIPPLTFPFLQDRKSTRL